MDSPLPLSFTDASNYDDPLHPTLTVTFKLLGITSANDIVFEVGSQGKSFQLEARNEAVHYRGESVFPFPIDENTCIVSFKKKKQQLILTASAFNNEISHNTDDSAFMREFYADDPHYTFPLSSANSPQTSLPCPPASSTCSSLSSSPLSSLPIPQPPPSLPSPPLTLPRKIEPDKGVDFYTPSLDIPGVFAKGIDARYLGVSLSLREGCGATSSSVGLSGMANNKIGPSAKARAKEQAKLDAILSDVTNHLEQHGYAVLDNFVPLHIVQAVRQELKVMRGCYSPGMIWVGKEASSGAEVKMKQVRGDVVLWLDDDALMATAFEAPAVEGKERIRKECCFVNMHAFLSMVDALVFDLLKPRHPSLRHLHMRTDAMATVYPSKGARFAKHIDNSTRDGRRLTVVTYLNPDWSLEGGGAIRLFPQRCCPEGVCEAEAEAEEEGGEGEEKGGEGKGGERSKSSNVPLSKTPSKTPSSQSSSNTSPSHSSSQPSSTTTSRINSASTPPSPAAAAGSKTYPPVDALPFCGRIAMFFSDEVPHEVMPAYGQRHAVTLWYYDADEHAQSLAEAKLDPGVKEADRKVAQELLRDLLADSMGITQESCEQLRDRLGRMTKAARGVVAAVTGAPSVAAFQEAMEKLTPDELRRLRDELRTMGLDTQHHQPDTERYKSI